MTTYQYQLLRYVHDQFTGEFVNIGVVVYSPEDLYLKALVIQKYSRITALFPDANGRFITKLSRHFDSEIKLVAKQLSEELFKPSVDLRSITKKMLPIDDSALQLSEPKVAMDIDLEYALHDLFAELVEKYIHNENDIKTLTDDDVWKKKYKDYFDKFQISNKLTNHEVATKNDIFSFDKAWKNDVWHCYQPISFDLQNKDSIKEKIYKWSGKLRELQQAEEKIHLTILASLSENHQSLHDFIFELLEQNSKSLDVEIVLDKDAERVARETHQLILQHELHNERS